MTELELLRNLNDSEFKVWKFIEFWRGETKTYTPDTEYIANKLDKDKRSVFRALAGLKEKGVITK